MNTDGKPPEPLFPESSLPWPESETEQGDKRILQLRYIAHRFWMGGSCGSRASTDVAIVSDEPTGQHNRTRNQGPLDSWFTSEAFGADWTQVPLRIPR
jgi:hypothetical protein